MPRGAIFQNSALKKGSKQCPFSKKCTILAPLGVLFHAKKVKNSTLFLTGELLTKHGLCFGCFSGPLPLRSLINGPPIGVCFRESLVVRLHSESDQIHLSIEAQCVTTLLPLGNLQSDMFYCFIKDLGSLWLCYIRKKLIAGTVTSECLFYHFWTAIKLHSLVQITWFKKPDPLIQTLPSSFHLAITIERIWCIKIPWNWPQLWPKEHYIPEPNWKLFWMV